VKSLVKSSVVTRIVLVPTLHKLLDQRGLADSIEEGPMVSTSLKAEIAKTRNGILCVDRCSVIREAGDHNRLPESQREVGR